MGSHENEKGRYGNEDRHQISLSKGFWLAETAVTQALWQVVMDKNPSQFEGENRPVENISWNDVRDFMGKFNQIHPNLTVRLPWEAEWEYACRAGTETPFNFDDELMLDKVNYNGYWDKWEFAEQAKKKTVVVKSYPCNRWGLYDMHGNVWEWCEDTWQEKLGREVVTDPWEGQEKPAAGAARVVRGGSWYNLGGDCRSAFRGGVGPDFRDDYLGFRLALGH